jgi:type II secretory pathway pseudopilin PulG
VTVRSSRADQVPLADRCSPKGDDGVALLMSLAYIAMFTLLMLSMLTVVVGQVKPTAQARKDVGSLNAASSGLQAALTALRSAKDVNGAGDRAQLPCTAGPVTTFRTGTMTSSTPGTVLTADPATVPGAFRYSVHFAYYLLDPTDQPPAWLQANAMTCPLTSTPQFAYLQAYGTGTNVARAGGSSGNRGNRSQTGVYRFSVPGANVDGGRLRLNGGAWCIDAGPTPAIGTVPTFTACAALGTRLSQLWEYRSDLTLFYGGNPALNLCIQGTPSQAPTLQRCTGTGSGATWPYYSARHQAQLWNYDDSGRFAAGAVNGDVDGNACLRPAAAGGTGAVLVGACDWGFDPDPEIGAGKAGGNTTGLVGSPTNQYVNFGEFGRCLDVSAQNTNSEFLIAYPCKQAPDSTRVRWNQIWRWQSLGGNRGRMHVNTGGKDWCLTVPTSPTPEEFVTTKVCVAGRVDQEWIATGEVPDSPSTSYNLVSVLRGTCMSISRSFGLAHQSAKVVLEPCDGRRLQKWNAPPSVPEAGLENRKEGTTPR